MTGEGGGPTTSAAKGIDGQGIETEVNVSEPFDKAREDYIVEETSSPPELDEGHQEPNEPFPAPSPAGGPSAGPTIDWSPSDEAADQAARALTEQIEEDLTHSQNTENGTSLDENEAVELQLREKFNSAAEEEDYDEGESI